MINVEERRCEKLSGITSIFLSFDYQEVIVSWIKQNIDIHIYNKKTKEWEVPILYLDKILDNLSVFDSLNIKLYKEKNHSLDAKQVIKNYKLKPFPYQEEAIRYGISHNKWLLLDGMGLGKSAQIIHIAEELKAQGKISHCLVICGIATLRGNWKKEIRIHSNETFKVIGEKVNKKGISSYLGIKDRINELLKPIDEFFLIINVETLRSDDFVNAIKYGPNDIGMIVVDEIHKCANKGSQQGKNLLKLKANYQIAATGTLLMNTPINAYLPLKWLDIDKANLTTYKQQYCQFGGFGGHEIIGYKNLDILKDEIETNSLRRTKESVLKSLPPKTVLNEIVTLSDEHRKFYKDVKKGVKDECDKIKLSTNNLLALVTRLRQATACPQILTTKNISSSKLDRCEDMVDELMNRGEKVVIFSTFKESVTYLEEKLKRYNPLICTGNTKDPEIDKNIDLFQNDDTHKLIIATHQKLGTGVTLNRASYMIFIDTPFTAAAFQQSCDRIYRIGTKNPVFIYNLICENTIDERVAEIISTKQAMSDYIIDDKLDNQNIQILKKYILDL